MSKTTEEACAAVKAAFASTPDVLILDKGPQQWDITVFVANDGPHTTTCSRPTTTEGTVHSEFEHHVLIYVPHMGIVIQVPRSALKRTARGLAVLPDAKIEHHIDRKITHPTPVSIPNRVLSQL